MILILIGSLFILSFGIEQDRRTMYFPKQEEVPSTLPHGRNFWIFIMAGQSNMAGRGLVEPQDTVPNARILTMNQHNEWVIAKEPLHFYQPKLTGLDSGVSFARELLKYVGDSITIGLVPCAVGGSSVDNWLSDEPFNEVKLLSNFTARAEYSLKCGQVKAILWHQGESDASPEKLPPYKSKIESLFGRFRTVLDNDRLPIIMGELGSYYYPEEKQALWDSVNVRIRSIANADLRYSLVPTSDLTCNDDRIHFNAASQRELGRRYAHAFISLQKK